MATTSGGEQQKNTTEETKNKNKRVSIYLGNNIIS